MTRVGIAGAGPWATLAMAPSLAAHPELTLSGIWARRPEAAEELARTHGTQAFSSFEDLLADSDAVMFCVPPDVQCALGTQAAQAGKHLLLDKPVGLTVAQVEQLAAAVDAAGVMTQVLLSNRYSATVRDYVAQCQARSLHGMQMTWVNGAVVEGKPFGTPWRLAEGVLYDLGPHAFDLAQACAGPVTDVDAKVTDQGWAAVRLTHSSGAISSLSMAFASSADRPVWRCEAFDATTNLRLDGDADRTAGAIATALSEFAAAVASGAAPELDVHHGLRLQALIDQAVRSAKV
jgi:predicted dehydrogenase